MLVILLLAACDGGENKPPEDTSTYTGCAGDPDIVVNAPQNGDVFDVGERVELSATATSSVGEPVAVLWAVDGDVEVIGAEGAWTPSAAGSYQLTVQGEDSCGVAQVVLDVSVRGGDTGDTGDTGGGDTGDTGGGGKGGGGKGGGDTGDTGGGGKGGGGKGGGKGASPE